MAKEDFCFNYYDGDAARDKAHMTRLERGAYDDIISAQRKRGHLSVDDIKRVLSKDFEECWPSLEWILKKDTEEKYFIEWVDKSISKMQAHSKKQKDNVDKRWGNTKSIPPINIGIETVIPLENGNGNEYGIENEIKDGGAGETIPVGVVPEMLQVFMVDNPDYPSDQLTDFPALRLIAGKILKWQKLKGDITLPENSDQIKLRWGELVPFVRADQHFGGYSILQINKYFQSIVQSFNNVPAVKYQRSHAGGSSEPRLGTSEARIKKSANWGRTEI